MTETTAVSGRDGVLAVDADGPALYAVLRADLYVEPLVAADADRFRRAAEILRVAIGEHMRFTVTPDSVYSEDEQSRVIPHRPEHFAHIGDAIPELAGEQADSDMELLAAMTEGAALEDLDISMKGGTDPTTASPWSVSFWAEVLEVDTDGLFNSPALLTFSVPLSVGADSFRDLALRVASELRVRWGNIGYGYASWEYFGGEAAVEKRRAHGLRFVGFDLGFHIFHMGDLMQRIRTVSWVTLLGDALWGQLPETSRSVLERELGAKSVGSFRWIQASPAPEAGDINRLSYPAGYVELDRLLRPIRLQAGLEGEGWEDRELDTWLRRFELAPPG